MNQSKVKDPRFWLVWKDSGSVSCLVNGVLVSAAKAEMIAAAARSAAAQYAARMTNQGAF